MTKPRLDLLVHPGLPKTSTTWFQTGLLPRLPMVVNIGKGGGSQEHGDVRPLSRELRAAQHQVFSEVECPDSMYRRYRSSIPDLIDFRDGIVDLVRARLGDRVDQQGAIVVLSDETLASWGGVEANVALLASLIEAVRERLETHFEVRPHVVLTIREQKAWLQSFYAFSHHRLSSRHRDIHDFIASGREDPQHGPFGLLHYDQILRLMDWVFGERATVTLVPSEYLRSEGGAGFALRLLHFVDDARMRNEIRVAADDLTEVEINAAQRSGNLTAAVTRTRMSTYVHRSATAFARASGRNNALARFVRPLREPLRATYETFRGTRLDELRIRSDVKVELSAEDCEAIDSLYAASNANLAEATSTRLSDLGYHCG